MPKQARTRRVRGVRSPEKTCLFRALVENSPDIIVRVDRELRYLYVSPLVAQYFQAANTQFIGKVCGSLGLGFDGSAEFINLLFEVLHTGKTLRRSMTLHSLEPELRLEAVVVPEYRHHKLVSAQAVLRDVSGMQTEWQSERQARRDLQVAGRVQKTLLPGDFANEYFEVRTVYEPFRIVSGDLFGYRLITDSLLRGYVIDVTGHGLATALQTAAINVLFQEYMKQSGGGAEAAAQLNERMREYFPEGSFAAVICFELNALTQQLYCWSGGINYMWGSTCYQQGMLEVPGSIMGVFEQVDIYDTSMNLQAGDCMYFLTDGLYEMLDRQHETRYGDFPGMMEYLQQLAVNPERWDDASGICIRLKSGHPVWHFVVNEAAELPSLRIRIHDILMRQLGGQSLRAEIAVNEALNNAARAALPIRVYLRKRGRRLWIRITDAGTGFSGNAYQPQADYNSVSGRGIKLMRTFMERVVFNRQGNSVLLSVRGDNNP